MAKHARYAPARHTKQIHVPLFRTTGSLSKSKLMPLIILGGQERHTTQAGGITRTCLGEANKVNKINQVNSRTIIMELKTHTSHLFKTNNLKANMQVKVSHLSNQDWRI